MTRVIVEQYGPQYPGEYWWQAVEDGVVVDSFWTRTPSPEAAQRVADRRAGNREANE